MSQQSDLAVALCGEGANLLQDALGTAGALSAADVGDDTVGAEVITAVHNRHPRLVTGRAVNGQTLCDIACVTGIQMEGTLLGVHGFPQDLGESPQHGGAEEEVDVRVFPLYVFLAMLLGDHTTADADHQRGLLLLQMLELARDRKSFQLCVFTDGAGIDENQIGKGRLGGGGVAHFHCHTAEPLGIGFVLLTAKGFDVDVQLTAAPEGAHLLHIVVLLPHLLGRDSNRFIHREKSPFHGDRLYFGDKSLSNILL